MDRDQALCERLGVVVERHSQAKIARETGVSRANVSLYARGRRMPASFVAALVDKLGVNPAWFLTGQGMPFELDVIPGAARADAAEELISALRAIAKLKFGELAGKHDLEDLRKLADALGEYQEHQDTIREIFEPLFERYEEAVDAAMADKDFVLATSLLDVSQRMAFLCRNRDQETRIMNYRGTLAYYRGNFAESLEIQRQVFLEALAYHGEDTFGRIGPIINHVLALNAAFQRDEALRVSRAALELLVNYEDEPSFQFLRNIMGYILLSKGRCNEALPILADSYARLDLRYKSRNIQTLKVGMLISGACEFTELEGVFKSFAFANAHAKAVFAALVLAHIPMLEDWPLLRRSVEIYGPAIEAVPPPFPVPTLWQSKCMLDAAENNDGDAWRRYLEEEQIATIAASSIAGDRIGQRLIAAEIARIGGNLPEAKRLLLEVRAILREGENRRQVNALGEIAYATALNAHFGKAAQRRSKSAPTSDEVAAAIARVRELRANGWALLDRHPHFAPAST